LSTYKFALRATGEAAEILEVIPNGEKTSFICKAIVAYYNNQLDESKSSELSEMVNCLRAVVGKLGEISGKLDNVTVSPGGGGNKPPEKKDKKATKKLDTSDLTNRFLHM
jgi:hypothetical protein